MYSHCDYIFSLLQLSFMYPDDIFFQHGVFKEFNRHGIMTVLIAIPGHATRINFLTVEVINGSIIYHLIDFQIAIRDGCVYVELCPEKIR